MNGLGTGFEWGLAGPAQTARSSPYESRLGPVQDLHGMERARVIMPLADPGPARAGPGLESTEPAFARKNSIVPRVARTNSAWDQARLAIWEASPSI